MFVKQRIIFLLAIITACAVAHAKDWHWQLSADRYKKMNTFERAQYDKAARLLDTNQPAAAATEFEKFKAQFGDSPNLSYCLFMRGYCLHQARQRNAAIKQYQEVVDYFPDQADDTAAALYFEGVADFDNGDNAKGIRCMKQMVESPLYIKSPLAAGALRRLADAAWQNKDPEQAVKYWRQAVKEFNHVNDQEYTAALANLTTYYIITQDYTAYENLVLDDDAAKQNPARHRAAADLVWNRGFTLYTQPFDRRKPISEKELAAEKKAWYDYFKSTRDWWTKANETSGYFDGALMILTRIHPDKDERDKLLTEALADAGKETDKTKADAHISRYCDIMREARQFDRARVCIAAMTDRVAASWKEHEILCDDNKWKDALTALEPVEASKDPQWQSRALIERARILKDALGEYEKAIALYERINVPPGTLWQIQDAYKRWGKPDKAIVTLSEIENLFPNDAPHAVWYKAAYYKEMGEKKKAIAEARHLLKAFPKSPDASPAHEMLENFGVPIGGGVSEE